MVDPFHASMYVACALCALVHLYAMQLDNEVYDKCNLVQHIKLGSHVI